LVAAVLVAHLLSSKVCEVVHHQGSLGCFAALEEGC
jgi:hypothetical protein